MTLIVRRFHDGGQQSEAVYSSCEAYRYALTRTWNERGGRLLYLMLNPSTATEEANDPTIERCERRARRLGYGAFRVCNLFALRETDPVRLKRAEDPVGPDNESQLVEAFQWADDILCAWGVHGAHRGQNLRILDLVKDSGKPTLVFGLTKHGHPRHPLYLPYFMFPKPWA